MFSLLIISITISLLFGVLGCFVLWQKYVYLSDAIAHTAVIAVLLNMIVDVPIYYAIIINAFIFTCGVYFLKKQFSDNTAIIGAISSVIMAFAFILSKIYVKNPHHIEHALFGNVMNVTLDDIYILLLITVIILLFIWSKYSEFLLMIFNKEVAKTYGIKVNLLEIVFLLILSTIILCSVKIIGGILVVGLLVIPALCARLISDSPFKMICRSIIIALVMHIFGGLLHYFYLIPFASAVIVSSTFVYVSCILIKRFSY